MTDAEEYVTKRLVFWQFVKDEGIELTDELLEKIIPAAIKLIEDNRVMPYEITQKMYADAMWAVENYQD